MSIVNNPWVNYITRSYSQIKTSLVNQLAINNPEVTDDSESNILIIIISQFAGVAEMLGYYIDNMARESFIATARRFPSMVKLVKILDYRIKAAYPSTVDILFTFDNPTTSASSIPAGTIVNTSNNLPFVIASVINIPSGSSSAVGGARQVVPVSNANIGITDGTINQAIPIGTNYVDGTAVLTVGVIPYTLVDTLGLSSPTDLVYIIEIDVDDIAYVVFGDNINGATPSTGQSVTISYDSTSGSLGNVNPNSINSVSGLTLPGVTLITVTNPLASSGGYDYEDIESIRRRAPLSIRTLLRAVTQQDYVDVMLLYAGVGKAAIDYSCGKTIPIYIVPVGGGIAQSPLLIGAQAWITTYKMLTTFPQVYPAGETPLTIGMTVTLKYRADPIQSLIDIQNALISYGAYINQNINKHVNTSDIIALIDNLPVVDFLKLTTLYTQPYARPDTSNQELFWVRSTLSTCITESNWELQFNGTDFVVIKNNVFKGNASIGVLFIDPDGDFEFTISIGPYLSGQSWLFTTYPYLQDIPLDDFTIPTVNVNDLTIALITQLIPPII